MNIPGKDFQALRTMPLAHALRNAKPPLEQLCIENGTSEGRWGQAGDKMAIVKSFAEFGSLEVIDILAFDQWAIPFGPADGWKSTIRPVAELLPRKIKRLMLRKALIWTVEQAIMLLAQRDGVSSLQTLTIEFLAHVRLNKIEGELSLLREAGVRSGIDVSVQGGTFIDADDADIYSGLSLGSIG